MYSFQLSTNTVRSSILTVDIDLRNQPAVDFNMANAPSDKIQQEQSIFAWAVIDHNHIESPNTFEALIPCVRLSYQHARQHIQNIKAHVSAVRTGIRWERDDPPWKDNMDIYRVTLHVISDNTHLHTLSTHRFPLRQPVLQEKNESGGDQGGAAVGADHNISGSNDLDETPTANPTGTQDDNRASTEVEDDDTFDCDSPMSTASNTTTVSSMGLELCWKCATMQKTYGTTYKRGRL
jgi:hypothetical protein